MLAISSGSTVTLWDNKNDDSTSYEPLGHTVSDISWTLDGSRLAACSCHSSVSTDDGPNMNIAITPINNDESMTLLLNVTNASSVSFGGNNSRYLCVSSSGDAVSIYDLKESIQTQLFTLPPVISNWKHDNICSKAHIVSDSMVAAASSLDESLYLYHMTENDTNMVPSRLCPFSNEELVGCSALCFTNQTTAAVGMNNGSIYIWDVEQESLSCSIDTSTISANGQSSITDMCFSPVNELLLASCSTEKLFFHDSKSSKLIATVDLSAHRGLLALSLSGSNCALGTKAGTVLIYDLRSLSSPITEWRAAADGNDISQCPEPVTCVRYQPMNQLPLISRINPSDRIKANIITKDEQPDAPIHSLQNDTNVKPARKQPVVRTNFLLDLANIGRVALPTKDEAPQKRGNNKDSLVCEDINGSITKNGRSMQTKVRDRNYESQLQMHS